LSWKNIKARLNEIKTGGLLFLKRVVNESGKEQKILKNLIQNPY